MANYEQMTDEQLIGKLRKGDKNIIDYIMEKYKNMVRKEANAMYLLGGENDDLIQEGMIGLFKAVQDYDVQQETSFYSFARLCITRQMYSAIEASRRKKHSPLNSYISQAKNRDRLWRRWRQGARATRRNCWSAGNMRSCWRLS